MEARQFNCDFINRKTKQKNENNKRCIFTCDVHNKDVQVN